MNDKTLISVIVPVFKVAKFLPRCIDSIINQTYFNLEIILVDDGSPDNCPEICDKYAEKDKRIKVIHKLNGGVSSARNVALDICKGDFVAFVDGDDWIEPTMYEDLINKQKETDADLVFCKHNEVYDNIVININETELPKLCKFNDISLFFKYSSSHKINKGVVKNKNVIPSMCRILFKKEIFEKNRLDTSIVFMEDLAFLVKLLTGKVLKLEFVDKYLYNYYMREDSAVHQKGQKMSDKGTSMLQNNINFINNLEFSLGNTKYSKLIPAIKYFCYAECVLSKYVYGANISLDLINNWGSKQNYQANKKLYCGLKSRVKYFLIYHKLYKLLKKLYEIKK